MATSEELRGFTIEKLRELCAERHIAIHTKKKEDLIAALMEVAPETKVPGAQGASTDLQQLALLLSGFVCAHHNQLYKCLVPYLTS